MLPITYKGFNRLLLMYINTSWLDVYVNSQLSLCCWCINTLWLGVYVRYTPWYMLDISQQNPLKYGFSGIEVHIHYTIDSIPQCPQGILSMIILKHPLIHIATCQTHTYRYMAHTAYMTHITMSKICHICHYHLLLTGCAQNSYRERVHEAKHSSGMGLGVISCNANKKESNFTSF